MPNSEIRRARIDMCLRLASMREALGECLGESFCPTPGLNMLLELYLANHENRAAYIWSLCMAAHIPFPTAHRKVSVLEEKGLLVREPAVRDRRRIGVKITSKGMDVVEDVLDRFLAILSLTPSNEKTRAVSPCVPADLPRAIGL